MEVLPWVKDKGQEDAWLKKKQEKKEEGKENQIAYLFSYFPRRRPTHAKLVTTNSDRFCHLLPPTKAY